LGKAHNCPERTRHSWILFFEIPYEIESFSHWGKKLSLKFARFLYLGLYSVVRVLQATTGGSETKFIATKIVDHFLTAKSEQGYSPLASDWRFH